MTAQTSEPGNPPIHLKARALAHWREWPLWVKFVIVAAFLSRFLFIEWKATHFDEGIVGHFVMQIWKTTFLQYDPKNFHGPFYYYLLHLSELLFGWGIFSYRCITALFSMATVVVVAMHGRYLGRAAHWAAAVVALSTAMVFYGRYAIHESVLIFGQAAFSYGFVRRRFQAGASAVAWMTTGVVVTIGTKETFFIFFGTWAIAWTSLWLVERYFPRRLRTGEAWPVALSVGGMRVWVTATAVATLVICALFTGFYAYPQGLSDMIAAFAFWAKTGTGATGHEKPFIYWLEVLLRYEPAALLALGLAPLVCLFGSLWMRLYTLVGFGLWLAYSLVPYKTPWCVIGFVWPLAFAFGYLVDLSWRRFEARKWRWVTGVLAAVALGYGSFVMLRLNFRDFEKVGEPYVYVQTTQDVPQVMRILNERLEREPESRDMRIIILHKSSWPLPWLFSRFSRVEYGTYKADRDLAADVILADGTDARAIEKRLERRYFKREMKIRDAYQAGVAYFDVQHFQPWFDDNAVRVGGKKQ